MWFLYELAFLWGYLLLLVSSAIDALLDDIFFLKDYDLGKKSAGSLFVFIFMEFNLGLNNLCY